MSSDEVIRYVLTYIGADGMRTLAEPMQGRYTFATELEAQGSLDTLLAANSIDQIRSIWGARFEVRPVECWPGHFDPNTRWFD